MNIDEFNKLISKKGDYGIFPPPLTDKEALDILIKHFLGDYYTINPISHEQYNTEAVYNIIYKYKGYEENIINRLKKIKRK